MSRLYRIVSTLYKIFFPHPHRDWNVRKHLIETREEPRSELDEPRFFVVSSFDEDFDSRLISVFCPVQKFNLMKLERSIEVTAETWRFFFLSNLLIEDCALRYLQRFFTKFEIFFVVTWIQTKKPFKLGFKQRSNFNLDLIRLSFFFAL